MQLTSVCSMLGLGAAEAMDRRATRARLLEAFGLGGLGELPAGGAADEGDRSPASSGEEGSP